MVSPTPPAICSLLLKALAKAGRAIWSPLRHKTTAHKSWQTEREGKRRTTCRSHRFLKYHKIYAQYVLPLISFLSMEMSYTSLPALSVTNTTWKNNEASACFVTTSRYFPLECPTAGGVNRPSERAVAPRDAVRTRAHGMGPKNNVARSVARFPRNGGN